MIPFMVCALLTLGWLAVTLTTIKWILEELVQVVECFKIWFSWKDFTDHLCNILLGLAMFMLELLVGYGLIHLFKEIMK